MKPPTPTEQELLDLVLREVRHACATKEQVTFTVDPFAAGGGCHVFFTYCHVFFTYNEPGLGYELTGPMVAQRKKARK